MEYYFKVADCVCCIKNNIELLNEKLNSLISTYTKVDKINTNSVLTINQNNFIIQTIDHNHFYDIEITSRDLYQIFYAFVSCVVIHNKNRVLIHSSIVSKNGKGILIIGDYSSGKTTLANTFLEAGCEINSADRTICEISNNQLINIQGTKKINNNDIITYLTDEQVTKPIEIETVLFLEGVNDNGDLKMNHIKDTTRIKKRLFYSIINIFFAPFEKKDQCMFNLVSECYYQICKNIASINIKFIALRGDTKKIVNQFI